MTYTISNIAAGVAGAGAIEVIHQAPSHSEVMEFGKLIMQGIAMLTPVFLELARRHKARRTARQEKKIDHTKNNS